MADIPHLPGQPGDDNVRRGREMQERLIDEILKMGFSTRDRRSMRDAAVRAGYSERAAKQAVHRLLRDSNFQDRLTQRLKAAGITDNEIIGNAAQMATATIADLIDIDPETGSWRWDLLKGVKTGAIHSVQQISVTKNGTTIKLYSRLDANRQLAEIRGLIKEPQRQSEIDLMRQEIRESIERVRLQQGDEAAEVYEGSLRRSKEFTPLFGNDMIDRAGADDPAA